MKKKLFALLMAMVLVLGTSTMVSADVNSPVVDNTTVNSPVVDNTVNSPVVDNTQDAVVPGGSGTGSVPSTDKVEDEVTVEEEITVEEAKKLLVEALKSEDPADAKEVLTSMSNETVAEMMKEDTSKVEAADKAWAEANDIKVEAKSEVKTVDASKISIVGAALNANGVDEKDVVLNIAEPEKKVEVDKKYENAVALNIELFVAGEAKADLDVPVAITMPIPEGVEKENLVILHYHGDAEEPVVIVPTVNEDGTMTFYVDGFSTFVIANQVVEAETTPADSATSTAPKTGDTSGTVMVCSLLLLAVGVVLVMKRNAFVK